jgi:CRISPR/Cas system CSM-associated protein Csm4 (group 5 of RAMP superfamily)
MIPHDSTWLNAQSSIEYRMNLKDGRIKPETESSAKDSWVEFLWEGQVEPEKFLGKINLDVEYYQHIKPVKENRWENLIGKERK